jgi:agmatine deiminase
MSASSFDNATPLEAGYRMPAEWEPHARCWMAWPHREDLWGVRLPQTQAAYARVARAIARFEPVTIVATPDAVAEAGRQCGSLVNTFSLEIDDAWVRDTGPAFLRTDDGSPAATAWHFNGWGRSIEPFQADARIAERLSAHLAFPLYRSALHLEGGAISVDGAGTVITTDSCLLNPNRNPGLTRRDAEQELCHALGASKVIWLPGELSEGDMTDGHVDGLACFARPGLLLLESRTDPSDPRAEVLRENRRALRGVSDARGRPIEIVEMEDAWQAERPNDAFCISYVNFYLANGGVIMPSYGIDTDAPARAIVERAFPRRRVIQLDVRDIATGGGGIHCITQQQPS